MIQEGVITLDKPTSETSVEELTELVVSEYRRAREEDRGEIPKAEIGGGAPPAQGRTTPAPGRRRLRPQARPARLADYSFCDVGLEQA